MIMLTTNHDYDDQHQDDANVYDNIYDDLARWSTLASLSSTTLTMIGQYWSWCWLGWSSWSWCWQGGSWSWCWQRWSCAVVNDPAPVSRLPRHHTWPTCHSSISPRFLLHFLFTFCDKFYRAGFFLEFAMTKLYIMLETIETTEK